MQVFDDVPRTDVGAATLLEPRYYYLNRTARPTFGRVRELIQGWVDHYLDLTSAEWEGRFRSNDDPHHVAAFFELWARALLDAQSLHVEREPAGEGTKRVEFLASDDRGPLFVLECRLAAGPSFLSPAKKRLRRLYDEIDKMGSGSFFLSVNVEAIGERDLPARQVKRWLDIELGKLDPDVVTAKYVGQGWKGLPQLLWQGDGWMLTFTPITKKAEAHGKPGHRILGMFSDTTRPLTAPLNTRGPLIEALEKKATRYGRPPIPYVIALDGLDDFVDEDSIIDVLFGSLAASWNLATAEITPTRIPNGFWIGKSGPRHRHVSAVLFVPHLFPHMISSASPVLWHNPWGDHPLDPQTWRVTQMVADAISGKMDRRDGQSSRELFGLPEDWPGWEEERRSERDRD